HVPTPHLDDVHSIFGQVNDSSDQAVIDSIAQGDQIVSVKVAGDIETLLDAQKDRVDEWNNS
ncbi:MAG TPA: hypothetical protein QF611_14105, partial [Pseudomonadales bacterium]|nr:hypothetical protein [Pseudomonadales bacterium]HJP52159.1 hypothetical protein [Pseudomonadales bacterium]